VTKWAEDRTKERQQIAAQSGQQFQPGCTGKRRYLNKHQVKRAVQTMKAHGHQAMHWYHCQTCGAWHLTHDSQGMNGAPI
jgi:type IV secretory pathway VirD2 relaxase